MHINLKFQDFFPPTTISAEVNESVAMVTIEYAKCLAASFREKGLMNELMGEING